MSLVCGVVLLERMTSCYSFYCSLTDMFVNVCCSLEVNLYTYRILLLGVVYNSKRKRKKQREKVACSEEFD